MFHNKNNILPMSLDVAAERGYAGYVADLLENGAEVNATSANGCTPLHLAAFKGHSACVALLLANGAEVNATDNDDGWTPLHLAAQGGHSACVAHLLKKGAHVNQASNAYKTPLHYSAEMGESACVELLLAHGANVNATYYKGWTPLHSSASTGKTSCIALLLAHGANANATDEEGWTPLKIAKINCHVAYVNQLERAIHCNNLGNAGWPFRLAWVAGFTPDKKSQLINRAAVAIAVSIFLDHPQYSPYLNQAYPTTKDIWYMILNFAVEMSLTKQEWEKLALLAGKEQIKYVLTDYAKPSSKGSHKDRAKSFQAAVVKAESRTALHDLVIQQSDLLRDPKQAPGGKEKYLQATRNKTVDGYHLLIHRWAKRFLKPAVAAAEDQSAQGGKEFAGFYLMPG